MRTCCRKIICCASLCCRDLILILHQWQPVNLFCVQGTVGNAPASLGTRRRLLTEAAADVEDEGPRSPLAGAFW